MVSCDEVARSREKEKNCRLREKATNPASLETVAWEGRQPLPPGDKSFSYFLTLLFCDSIRLFISQTYVLTSEICLNTPRRAINPYLMNLHQDFSALNSNCRRAETEFQLTFLAQDLSVVWLTRTAANQLRNCN